MNLITGGLPWEEAKSRILFETLNAEFGVSGVSKKDLFQRMPVLSMMTLHMRALSQREIQISQRIALAGGDPPPQRIFLPEELRSMDKNKKVDAGKIARLKSGMQRAKNIKISS